MNEIIERDKIIKRMEELGVKFKEMVVILDVVNEQFKIFKDVLEKMSAEIKAVDLTKREGVN